MSNGVKQAVLKAVQAIGVPIAVLAGAGERSRGGLALPTTRADFLKTVPRGDILELGPFDNPTLTGPGIAYFDVLDAQALRARAAAIGYGGTRIPDRIDFVSPNGDLGVVDRQFAAVLSCHVIEHQPDLIAHLQGVERLLRAGGIYHLIVPDRRYTFDHFLPETTLEDVEAAHREGRKVHTRAAILDHRLRTTHNNPLRHWLGVHGKPAPTDHMQRDAEAEAARAEGGEYIDVHAWAFSPSGFATLMRQLAERGHIRLALDKVHATRFADLEFFAALRLP